MNGAHFAKVFPKNACKYGETTTKDLFTLTLLSVIFWTLYMGKNGRVEFWQIAQIVRNIFMNLMTAPLIQFHTDIN